MNLRQRMIGLSILALGVLAFGGASADGAHPGANGAIAFQGHTGVSFGHNIFTVNDDGTGLTNVTQNAVDNEWYQDFGGFTPTWSPDGSRIAFDAVAPITFPSVNPVADQCESDQSIWVITPSSGDVEPIRCYFSSVGTYITPEHMSWSPDGSQLVVDHDREQGEGQSRIYLIDVDTGTASVLVAPEPFQFCGPFSYEGVGGASWSPAGDAIVYSRNDLETCSPGNEVTGIWTIQPDGSNRTRVTAGPDISPDWSPDGSKIVFARRLDPNWCPNSACGGALYVVDSSGGTPELLTSVGINSRPVFSPDGTKIAFASNRDGDFDIYVMNADGSNVEQVTNMAFNEFDPSWQPNTTPPDPDADDDGVDDSIDTGVGTFDDGDGTAGSIVDTAGLAVIVSDADDSGDGVRIAVGPGSGKATFLVCGLTVKVAAGSEIVVTCGSITVDVLEGSAEVELGGGAVRVSVPEGGRAKISEDGGTFFAVENLGTTSVTVIVDGEETVLSPGETTSVSTDVTAPTVTCASAATWLLNQPGATVSATVADAESGPVEALVTRAVSTSSPGVQSAELTGIDQAGNSMTVACAYRVAYVFQGFFQPIDNPPTVNSAKAGQAIPVKWRISDYFGVGVASANSFVSLTTGSLTCDVSDPQDTIETYAGGSGLQYLGNGNWQFNWKTAKSLAGQCRVMQLNLADDATNRRAEFRFK